MKKKFMGLGLIALALLILFKDALGLSNIPFWPTVGAVGFGMLAFNNLLEGEWVGTAVLGVISLSCANSIFNWFDISFGTLLLVAILLGIGFNMVFKPRRFKFVFNGKTRKYSHHGNGFSSSGSDTVFGNTTRYVNDDNFIDLDGDLIFSGTSIYFDNAVILGDTATYSGDAIFSRVKLYVPQNWKVEFTGERIFSTIDAKPSGAPTDKTLVVTGDYIFSRLMIYYI